MQKTWRHVYNWGDTHKKIDPTIQHHIHHFQHLLGIEGGHSDLPLNANANEEVRLTKRSKLSKIHLRELMRLVGSENVMVDDFSRAKHAFGKYYGDILRMRMGKIANPPDAVVCPRAEEDVIKVVKYCNAKKIAIIPWGGGTSVTRALEADKGGIALDLTLHLKDVFSLNAEDSTVTVEAGILGPDLEQYLNDRGYTCGHFPQSFEFATVGGWVAARGAGQASTGYGRIEDLLIGLRIVTPAGAISCGNYPAASVGGDIRHFVLGSEGTLGVITRVTLRVRKYAAENAILKSYMFKSFEDAVAAMRNMMQSQVHPPHFFRISDPEETEIGLGMKGKDKGIAGGMLNLLGYKKGGRSLMYAIFEGNPDQCKLGARTLGRIVRRHHGLSLGSYATRKWLEQRYSSAYMRDPMMNAGIRIDTIETSVHYTQLIELWQAVRQYVKSDGQTLCLTHISHTYETGANLYFIFATPMLAKDELGEYEKFHKGLVATFMTHGGTLSHHHGIGRLLAHSLDRQHSPATLEAWRGVKKALDPKGIMNPGALIF
jgi:alkyldihydroxyacetonephosphate synthase